MRSLAPIPTWQPITEKPGTITQYFRLRWQELMDGFTASPTAGGSGGLLTGLHASISTTLLLTTPSNGLYRVSYYLRKTTADGVASSLTFTWGWLDHGVALTENASALTTDTTSAQQSGSKVVYADAASSLTYAVTYSSNTPNAMVDEISVSVEQLV